MKIKKLMIFVESFDNKFPIKEKNDLGKIEPIKPTGMVFTQSKKNIPDKTDEIHTNGFNYN